MITAIGLIAALLTTGSLVPQVIKTYRTKSTGDLSLGMYLMMFSGVILWLIYGLLVRDIPIIAANFVTSILNLIILYFKLSEKKEDKF